MTHFCELFTSQAIRTLRGASFEQAVVNNKHLSPEVYFNWDDEKGDVQIKAVSQPNTLLDLKIDVNAEPRWFSVNVGLGHGHLIAGDCVGVILEAETTVPCELISFIRSAVEDGHGDTVLTPQNLEPAGRQILSTLHMVKDEDMLTNDGFHTLVIRLPRISHTLSLHDLRLFVVPADQAQAMLFD